MEQCDIRKELYGFLGRCLEYPLEDFRAEFKQMNDEILSLSNMAAYNFQEFVANINKMSFCEWQEYYVKTFDVTPQCGLYLSVHLFGEENYKRAELMTGLKAVYERKSAFKMSELPDHLSVIFNMYAEFNDEEWSDLVNMCMIPALSKIAELLEKHNNPYAFLIKTIKELELNTEKANV